MNLEKAQSVTSSVQGLPPGWEETVDKLVVLLDDLQIPIEAITDLGDFGCKRPARLNSSASGLTQPQKMQIVKGIQQADPRTYLGSIYSAVPAQFKAYSGSNALWMVSPDVLRNAFINPSLIEFLAFKDWPGASTQDKLIFEDIGRIADAWLPKRDGNSFNQHLKFINHLVYARARSTAESLNIGCKGPFLSALFDTVVMRCGVLKEKYAAYPFWLGVVTSETEVGEDRNGAIAYLQANQSMAQLLCRMDPNLRKLQIKPSWWTKDLCENPNYVPSEEDCAAFCKIAAENDYQERPAKEVKAWLTSLKFTGAAYSLLTRTPHEIELAWKVDAHARRESAQPHKVISAESLCVDPTYRRTPAALLSDINAEINCLNASPGLKKFAKKQWDTLITLRTKLVTLEAESKTGPELAERVVYLSAHDAELIEMSTRVEAVLSSLQTSKSEFRLVEELGHVNQRKPPHSRRKTAQAAKAAQISGKQAEITPQPAATKAEAPTVSTSQSATEPAATATPLIGKPSDPEIVEPSSFLLRSPRGTSLDPNAMLGIFNMFAPQMAQDPIHPKLIGGVTLRTALSTNKLVTIMQFMAESTFKDYAKIELGARYDDKLSGPAFSLQWHIKKHFGASAPSSNVEPEMTAEEFIRGAYATAAHPQTKKYFVRSAVDPKEYVPKFVGNGYFSILSRNYKVLTFGRDEQNYLRTA